MISAILILFIMIHCNIGGFPFGLAIFNIVVKLLMAGIKMGGNK